MKLNEGKSGIIFIRKVGDNKNKQRFPKKEFEGIPVKKSYKYLGIHIDEELNFNE